MDCYRRDWLKSDLSVDFISFGISKQSEIVEETEKLGRQIGIVGDLRVGIFVERSSNLFAVTLREVDDVGAGGRKVNQRPCTSLPQLRVYALLLLCTNQYYYCCQHTHKYKEKRLSHLHRDRLEELQAAASSSLGGCVQRVCETQCNAHYSLFLLS